MNKKININTIRMIVRETLLENLREASVVRIDPKADRMIHDIRSVLGEKEFVASLLAKIDSRDLKRILRSIASDRKLEVDGIQYV